MAEDARSKRAAALEEKKRRLEELKARRTNRATGTTSSSAGGDGAAVPSSAIGASRTGNLDEYIDGLLSSAAPSVPGTGAASASTKATATSTVSSSGGLEDGSCHSTGEESSLTEAVAAAREGGSAAAAATGLTLSASVGGAATASATKMVETFTFGTQTEDDDFPPQDDVSDDGDNDGDGDNDDDNDNEKEEQAMNVNEMNGLSLKEEERRLAQKLREANQLSSEQVNQTLSSAPFSQFFTSASKKVERLLGAPLLADLLVDDSAYYTSTDDTQPHHASDATSSSHALLAAKVTFDYPKWTSTRDITSLDWSPLRKGELLLASYHTPANLSSSTNTAISSLSPKPTPSSSLTLPRSTALQDKAADGLVLLWNLAMPSRPEHIFTCGSPVLASKFHPTEGNLVIGSTYSGQIVVWDVRSGRLPVQRSSLSHLAGKMGHSHPVVAMEFLDGTSGLVTAANDGRLNFWSLSNLREPAETLIVPGGNISTLAVAPESHSLLVGDETGSLHAILSSSSSPAVSDRTTSADRNANSTSTTSRRIVRKLGPTAALDDPAHGHYGMVTGLSTRVSHSYSAKAGSTGGAALSKGFVRGANGLVLTCGVDWSTKLWAPAFTEKPILNLLSHSYDYMCDVQWSPAHPSIFATASSNGSLGLWNLAHSVEEPITGSNGIMVDSIADLGADGGVGANVPVANGGAGGSSSSLPSRGLNKLKWSLDGRRIAVASSDTLHVLGMAEEVWRPTGDEEVRMMSNLRGRGLLVDEE